MIENWVPISGYEGLYEVSDLGNVKSLDGIFRNQHAAWPKKGKVLKPRVHTVGYLRVNLWLNEKPKDKYIHRLVADAFLPFDPLRSYINHKDGNKQNNALSNLERCSAQENIDHAVRYGLYPKNNNAGVKNGQAILDEMQVRTIRSCHKDGISPKDLAAYFKLHRGTIYPIVNGKSWKQVTEL